MRLKRVYLPDVMKGTTIVFRDGPYAVSFCANQSKGSLYIDKCAFYAIGLPLFETVQWKIHDDYIDFYKDTT